MPPEGWRRRGGSGGRGERTCTHSTHTWVKGVKGSGEINMLTRVSLPGGGGSRGGL
jgi:hypothetical protein